MLVHWYRLDQGEEGINQYTTKRVAPVLWHPEMVGARLKLMYIKVPVNFITALIPTMQHLFHVSFQLK